VKVRYRFRFYPTPEQEHILARTFGACRYVYNWALRLRTDAYQAGGRINYNQSSAALTDLKTQPEHAWLNEIHSVPVQQSLRHLQTAFRNFFEKRAAYPSFRKKRGRQSAEYTTSAFRWDAERKVLRIPQAGSLKIRWSRDFTSAPTTVTITKHEDGRWFATLVLDEKIEKLPKTGKNVGVDLGISRLATLSNGERIPNPRALARRTRQLVRAQRVLSRRKRGSGRRCRQKLCVARIHSRIADARADHLHKITTDLVRRFDVICMEDLNIRGMVRNHHLARSLSDAALGMFDRMVGYKCGWYGKEQRHVDRFFPSSKRCHVCGYILESLPLDVREWDCPECKTHHDRDENAAKNIESEGKSLPAAGHAVGIARGGSARPVRASARKGSIRRTVNQPGNRCSHRASGIRLL